PGAGVDQHTPALHLDRRERLLAKPFDDRRGGTEKGGEAADSLELLDGGCDEPRLHAAIRADGVEAWTRGPERFAGFRPSRSQIIDQGIEGAHAGGAVAEFRGDAREGRQPGGSRSTLAQGLRQTKGEEKGSATLRQRLLGRAPH